MRQPAISSLKVPCKFGAKNKVEMTSIFPQSCSLDQYEKSQAELVICHRMTVSSGLMLMFLPLPIYGMGSSTPAHQLTPALWEITTVLSVEISSKHQLTGSHQHHHRIDHRSVAPTTRTEKSANLKTTLDNFTTLEAVQWEKKVKRK